ncbi:MAG: phosphatidylglycerol lysyltransferase, partial [Acidobacteriota bacterium]|nr:phosphatidylglycerol lysyltransferase [Acidobacteriota bacterium]
MSAVSSEAVRSAAVRERGTAVRWTRYLLPAAKAIIFLIALRVISGELRQFHYRAVAAYVDALPWPRLALAILCTAASYLILASYDVLAIRDAGHPLPLRKTAFGSFVSYAVSNSMSNLVGGSLRYRLYTAWGLTPAEAARVIAFGIVTFWLGFLSMAGVVLTARPVIGAIGPMLLIVPAAYLTVVIARRRHIAIGRWSVAIPSPAIAALQLTLSSADWIFAAGAFHALLPAHSGIHPLTTLAVFLAAQLLGIVSTLPGGVGVFEATVFALLGAQAGTSVLAGALLAYRALYYLAPLATAGIAVAVQEVARRRQGLTRIGRGVARTLSLFVPPVFSLAVFLAGVVLLASGATPTEAERLHALRAAVPLTLVELAHLVGSMAGIGLLLLARGVQRRLDGAWALSSALLLAGIVASLAKGLDYEEAILLAITLAALLPCRAYFYRKTALLDEPFTPAWVMAIALAGISTLWLGFFAYRRIAYSHELWWHFSFSGDAPRFLRATIGVAAVALVFSARKLLRPAPRNLPATSPADVTCVEAIARAAPATVGFLALLPDKTLLVNDERTAFVMYGVQGRSWVSMGDPIGPPRAARELAWTFFEEADRHNGWPVFYQVRRT